MKLRNSFDNTSSIKDVYTDPKKAEDINSPDHDPTQQQFKDSCDINIIMSKVQAGQELPEPSAFMSYEDVSNVPDLMTSKNLIIKAMNNFLTMPIEVRKRYEHNPELFINALVDPEEKEFLTKHGIFEAPKEVPVDYQKQMAENIEKMANKAAQLPS